MSTATDPVGRNKPRTDRTVQLAAEELGWAGPWESSGEVQLGAF